METDDDLCTPMPSLEEPLVTENAADGYVGVNLLDKLWPDQDGEQENLLLRSGNLSRPVVHIDAAGVASVIEFHKHDIVRDLSIRYREAMMLDPSIPIPFPASVLIREKAIILNMEAVRMIVCANQCYILSVPKIGDLSSGVTPTLDHPFIQYLCQCLAHVNDPVGHVPSQKDLSAASLGHNDAGNHSTNGNIVGKEFDPDTPYELRALEVALRVVLRALRIELHLLETTGYPALEKMNRCVTALTLKQVRDLKRDLAELTKRVETLKYEVDRVLNSDHDLADMYLGRRAVEQGIGLPPQPQDLSTSSTSKNSDSSGGVEGAAAIRESASDDAEKVLQMLPPASIRAMKHTNTRKARYKQNAGAILKAVTAAQAWKRKGLESKGEEESQGDGKEKQTTESQFGRFAASAAAIGAFSQMGAKESEDGPELLAAQKLLGINIDPHDIEAAEDLMESAFINLDHILRSLILMAERIAHDELLLRISMDSRRNSLVSLELFVSNISMGLAWVAAMAGLWGMNLYNTEWLQSSEVFFWWVIAMCSLGLILLPLSVVWYMRKNRLNLMFDAAL